MKTVTLHGEDYRLGIDKAISIGYNTKCNFCLTTGVLHHDSDGFYVKTGGIAIKVYEEGLEEWYLDTPENRKVIKQKIQTKQTR